MLHNKSSHVYPATQRVKAEQNVNKSTFVLEDVRACVCVPVRAHTHTCAVGDSELLLPEVGKNPKVALR